MPKWLFLFPLLSLVGCAATPEPKFDLLGKSGSFEVRRYHPRLIAQTTVDAAYDDAPNIGFRRLADYIFGNNSTSASIEMTAPVGIASTRPKPASTNIEMTAPVTITPNNATQYVISFTMPENYTLATLPKPNNSQIAISQLPPKTYAAVRFAGTTGVDTVQAKTDELRTFIKSAHLIAVDAAAGPAPTLARYDPPWTLPWFRRNEILLEIQDPGPELKLPVDDAAR